MFGTFVNNISVIRYIYITRIIKMTITRALFSRCVRRHLATLFVVHVRHEMHGCHGFPARLGRRQRKRLLVGYVRYFWNISKSRCIMCSVYYTYWTYGRMYGQWCNIGECTRTGLEIFLKFYSCPRTHFISLHSYTKIPNTL